MGGIRSGAPIYGGLGMSASSGGVCGSVDCHDTGPRTRCVTRLRLRFQSREASTIFQSAYARSRSEEHILAPFAIETAHRHRLTQGTQPISARRRGQLSLPTGCSDARPGSLVGKPIAARPKDSGKCSRWEYARRCRVRVRSTAKPRERCLVVRQRCRPSACPSPMSTPVRSSRRARTRFPRSPPNAEMQFTRMTQSLSAVE